MYVNWFSSNGIKIMIFFELTAKTYPVRFIYSKKTITVHLPKALMINICTLTV